MRTIKKGEGYGRQHSVVGNVVKFVHATLNKPSGKVYVLTTSFDFANVSQSTILRWAGEALLIRWRTAFKASKEVTEKDDNEVVQVAKMLTRKPRKDKVQALSELAGKLTKEQLRKAMAELQARMDAEEEEGLEEFEDEEGEEELEDEEESEEDEENEK